MTNTFALTDYDVYQENDNFLGTVIAGRYFRKRIRRKRRKRINKQRRLNRPKLSRPPRRTRPKIVKIRPLKSPSVARNTEAPVPKKKPVTIPPNVLARKKIKAPPKTTINELIEKTNPVVVKTPLSKESAVELKKIENHSIEASKKAIKSDSKVSKVIKVIAVAGTLGIIGYGVYKYVQISKSQTDINKSNQL